MVTAGICTPETLLARVCQSTSPVAGRIAAALADESSAHTHHPQSAAETNPPIYSFQKPSAKDGLSEGRDKKRKCCSNGQAEWFTTATGYQKLRKAADRRIEKHHVWEMGWDPGSDIVSCQRGITRGSNTTFWASQLNS